MQIILNTLSRGPVRNWRSDSSKTHNKPFILKKRHIINPLPSEPANQCKLLLQQTLQILQILPNLVVITCPWISISWPWHFCQKKKKMVLIYFVKKPTGLVPHFKLIHVHGTCTPPFSCPTGGDNFGSKSSNGTYRPNIWDAFMKQKCRIGRKNHIKPTWTFALSLLSFVPRLI